MTCSLTPRRQLAPGVDFTPQLGSEVRRATFDIESHLLLEPEPSLQHASHSAPASLHSPLVHAAARPRHDKAASTNDEHMLDGVSLLDVEHQNPTDAQSALLAKVTRTRGCQFLVPLTSDAHGLTPTLNSFLLAFSRT